MQINSSFNSLEFSLLRIFRVTHFPPPKWYKPTKQTFWCPKNIYGFVWKDSCSDYSELPNVLHRDVNGDNFAEGREGCNIRGCLLDNGVEDSEDYGCSKDQDLSKTDLKTWICWKYHFWRKSTFCYTERNAKLFDNWTMQHLKFYSCNVKLFVRIYGIKFFKIVQFFPRFKIE